MRIEAYNKVNQIYQSNNVKAMEGAKKSGKSDQLEISQTGKDYQIAKQAIAAVDEVRADKIADIKSRMASGNYNVTMNEVVDKLVDNYFDTIV
ncbi:MAG TPA: flagellar biosynthesis anti-sigma factor FlgM [Lachnospiraceae bacterium]|nr:flagellar biosynthesis anti-sigma factor FlgM [Lachnospiraceae bacterium]